MALVVLDLDFRRVLREGVGERRDIRAHLARAVDGVDDGPRVGAQHAALVGHHDVGDALAHAVHGPRRPAAPRSVLALAADRAHVVVALVHLREQCRDLLGRILQVGVERHDALAAHMLEAGDDGHVLAEVAVEEDHARHVGALLELLAQHRRRLVDAAVVHEDHFVGRPRRSSAG